MKDKFKNTIYIIVLDYKKAVVDTYKLKLKEAFQLSDGEGLPSRILDNYNHSSYEWMSVSGKERITVNIGKGVNFKLVPEDPTNFTIKPIY